MGSTLAQFRASLRQDLRDEDAAAYVWTDAVLNRHVLHAVADVQRVAPKLLSLAKTIPNPAPRRLDFTADVPSTFLYADALEYPVDRYPQEFIPFREEAGPKLYLLADTVPAAGEQVTLWYAAAYTVAESSGDLPTDLDPIVLTGAAAYACLDQAVDVIDKLTPRDAAAGYRALGQDRAARFEAMLRDLAVRFGGPRWRPAWTLPKENEE